jgi:hypothetical protein
MLRKSGLHLQLWCWIDNDWAPLRIFSYYAPVWSCIAAALMIYVLVGIEIFQKRAQLRAAAENYNNTSAPTVEASPFTGIRTTKIEVTHDQWSQGEVLSRTSPTATCNKKSNRDKDNAYSITISSPNRAAQQQTPALITKRPYSMDKIKWAYMKVSLLFAVSILITWVPASINRIYGLYHPNDPSFALNIGSAVVLPLQGFWNTVIYFSTSLLICRATWQRFKTRKADAGFMKLEIPHWKPKAINPSQMRTSDSTRELSAKESISREGSGSPESY